MQQTLQIELLLTAAVFLLFSCSPAPSLGNGGHPPDGSTGIGADASVDGGSDGGVWSEDGGAQDAGASDSGAGDAGGAALDGGCGPGLVEALPYFLPEALDALPNTPQFNLGGTTTYRLGVNAVGATPDPTKLPPQYDRPGVRYYALTKFNNPSYFEIYEADAQHLSILFEVSTGNYGVYENSNDPSYHHADWRPNIRRFNRNPDDAVSAGLEVLPRCIAPGQLYRVDGVDQQRFVWDNVSEGGRWLETESVGPGGVDYATFEQRTGASDVSYLSSDGGLVQVTDQLIKHSYWHDTGAIDEDYVFGRNLGLVWWYWYERMADDSGQYGPKVAYDAASMKYVYTCLDGTTTVSIGAAEWATQAQVDHLNATRRLRGGAPDSIVLKKQHNPRVYLFFPSYPLQQVWYAPCNQTLSTSLTAPANLANLNLDPSRSGPGQAPQLPQVFDLPFDAPTHPRLDGPFVSVSTTNNLVWTAAVPFYEQSLSPTDLSAPVRYVAVPSALGYCVKYAPVGTLLATTSCIETPNAWYTLPSGLQPGDYRWEVSVDGARTPRSTGGAFTIAP